MNAAFTIVDPVGPVPCNPIRKAFGRAPGKRNAGARQAVAGMRTSLNDIDIRDCKSNNESR